MSWFAEWRAVRRADALARMARVLLAAPDGPHFGYPLAKAAGIRSARMYRELDWLLRDGWLEAGWETETREDRPPRRWYRVTPEGRAQLVLVVAATGTPP